MCGGVRFEVSEPLLGALFCHCKRCQRRTGTGVSTTALTAPGSYRTVSGQDLVRTWDPGDGGVRQGLLLHLRQPAIHPPPRQPRTARRTYGRP